jgi:hypothetical protein
MRVPRLPIFAVTSVLAGAAAAQAPRLPADFVFLRDVDRSIRQDIRYAGPNNFTGHPLPGYDGAECGRSAAWNAKRGMVRCRAGTVMSSEFGRIPGRSATLLRCALPGKQTTVAISPTSPPRPPDRNSRSCC